MTTLVMGATGNVGRPLVDQLLDAGQHVRAMTRDATQDNGLPAGVEVREGDFRTLESLPAVLDGVERVYLFSEPETAQAVVSQVVKAGVRRIVALSSIMADKQGGSSQVENPVERAVRAADIEWTILRPGPFAMNARNWWAQAIRDHGVVRWIYPEASMAPIHEVDVAAVAAAALLEEGHTGQKYELSGPEVVTQTDQVHAIGKELGREIPFEEISLEEARVMLRWGGAPDTIIDKLIDLLGEMQSTETRMEPTVEQVTGRPARTFTEWVTDHVDDFR